MLLGFKKWCIQGLQIVLLIPAFILDGITMGIGVGLQKWKKSLPKDTKSTKYKVCSTIINLCTIGLPFLSVQLGKGVSWCQGKINEQIAKLKPSVEAKNA